MNNSEFTPKWMAALVFSPILFSWLYWLTGRSFVHNSMHWFEYLELTSLIAAVVAGGYQLYFWTQRNSGFFKTRCLKIKLDDYIPFWPRWIWIYSFLYYVLIGGFIVMIPTLERGIYVIFGGLVLLVSQCLMFILFPCVNPPEWRQFEADTLSKKFLKFVQAFDGENNCFPSMHCSLATYISLTMFQSIGFWSYVPIALIAISCLFTKQHQFLDVIPGIALGAGVYLLVF